MVAIGYLNSQIIWDFLYYQYGYTAKPSNFTIIPMTSYDYNEASRRLVNKPSGNNQSRFLWHISNRIPSAWNEGVVVFHYSTEGHRGSTDEALTQEILFNGSP
jgi:hypothetical protein